MQAMIEDESKELCVRGPDEVQLQGMRGCSTVSWSVVDEHALWWGMLQHMAQIASASKKCTLDHRAAAWSQDADREALATAEDSAGDVGARLQQLDADTAALREQIASTEAGLASAQQQLAARKEEHVAAAATNRRALCESLRFCDADKGPADAAYFSCLFRDVAALHGLLG